jgi:hypothetical protein
MTGVQHYEYEFRAPFGPHWINKPRRWALWLLPLLIAGWVGYGFGQHQERDRFCSRYLTPGSGTNTYDVCMLAPGQE